MRNLPESILLTEMPLLVAPSSTLEGGDAVWDGTTTTPVPLDPDTFNDGTILKLCGGILDPEDAGVETALMDSADVVEETGGNSDELIIKLRLLEDWSTGWDGGCSAKNKVGEREKFEETLPMHLRVQ